MISLIQQNTNKNYYKPTFKAFPKPEGEALSRFNKLMNDFLPSEKVIISDELRKIVQERSNDKYVDMFFGAGTTVNFLEIAYRKFECPPKFIVSFHEKFKEENGENAVNVFIEAVKAASKRVAEKDAEAGIEANAGGEVNVLKNVWG